MKPFVVSLILRVSSEFLTLNQGYLNFLNICSFGLILNEYLQVVIVFQSRRPSSYYEYCIEPWVLLTLFKLQKYLYILHVSINIKHTCIINIAFLQI